MDIIQDYLPYLTTYLPPSLLTTLITLTSSTFGILKTLQTHLTPFFYRLISQPDAYSIALLLIALFISLKVLDMAYRAVLFWVNLVFKLVLYGGMLAVGMWVYQRGVDGFVDDVSGLVEFWGSKYEGYSEDVKRYKGVKEREMKRQAGVGGAGGRTRINRRW